ncbi:uncharacterized protein SOCE26_052840 [Sorangium cellulosum]|uniref:Uncharacterized protein n=1 Tax=Sorangium cellulosum TaxID=56 RepID=A0A2L0EX55_SORCE|nr:uncharacterized protein SOCE26_052840 [Sorangium cellulosum]
MLGVKCRPAPRVVAAAALASCVVPEGDRSCAACHADCGVLRSECHAKCDEDLRCVMESDAAEGQGGASSAQAGVRRAGAPAYGAADLERA